MSINKFIILIAITCLASCAAKQNSISAQTNNNTTNLCPENGKCELEVIPNQSLQIAKDGIGALYPKISEGNKTLFKFEYKRNEIENTVDGQYREIIYLELDPEDLEVELNNIELQNVKALFARLCFCRGQTGYYPLREGHLSIKKLNEDAYHLKLDFKVTEVPQVLQTVDQVFTLK